MHFSGQAFAWARRSRQLLQIPARKNTHNGMLQLHRSPMESTGRPEICNALAVTAGDCALASFHNGQQGDIARPAVE
jgi:hypothetical protein